MQEVWKPVEMSGGRYAVSDFGRVMNTTTGHILKPGRMPGGHRSVVLGRKLGSHCVHKLVLLAFVGPPPFKHECRHLNGDPSDNRLTNLAWGTRRENARDRCLHRGRGWKLSIEEAQQIKVLLPTHSDKKLADRFNVTANAIRNIRIGRAFVNA